MKKLIAVPVAILCIFLLVDYGLLNMNFLLEHTSSAVQSVSHLCGVVAVCPP